MGASVHHAFLRIGSQKQGLAKQKNMQAKARIEPASNGIIKSVPLVTEQGEVI